MDLALNDILNGLGGFGYNDILNGHRGKLESNYADGSHHGSGLNSRKSHLPRLNNHRQNEWGRFWQERMILFWRGWWKTHLPRPRLPRRRPSFGASIGRGLIQLLRTMRFVFGMHGQPCMISEIRTPGWMKNFDNLQFGIKIMNFSISWIWRNKSLLIIFFPPRRRVIGAKRTDELLFVSFLILEIVTWKFQGDYFSNQETGK